VFACLFCLFVNGGGGRDLRPSGGQWSLGLRPLGQRTERGGEPVRRVVTLDYHRYLMTDERRFLWFAMVRHRPLPGRMSIWDEETKRLPGNVIVRTNPTKLAIHPKPAERAASR
jgi:hypothetical protein